MSKLINLRKDLINEELKYDIKRGYNFHYKKLSNKFLDWLFRHYYIQEFCENYYDSEPREYPINSLDYENARIGFCNWQEPYFKGNWGMSQNTVDENAKRTLLYIKKYFPTSIKERLYYSQNDDLFLIYFYGRDLWDIDFWFIFKRKKNKTPRRVKRSNLR